jgi:uncharacterized membrane protein YuzA (DUF378 family)
MSVKLDIVAKVLVLVGAFNWLLIGSFNLNGVKKMLPKFEHTLYVLIGVAGLYLSIQRDFYLPFLGTTAFPQSICQPVQPPGAASQVVVNVKPGCKVIYWAADPHDRVRDTPRLAYRDYKNAGVTVANALGEAILNVQTPAAYQVQHFPGFSRLLEPHVHYRVSTSNPGMWGPVQTVYLN